jgi:uncharacterized protein (TIGR00369 family)
MRSSIEELIKQGENSPFYQLLNIKIEEVREDYARLSITVEKKHIQFLKTVHGGVIACLADSAAAWPILHSPKLEGTPVTVEMKINFLKPVTSGKIVAEARNIHRGSRIYVSDVEVKNSGGDLIAKSLVTYYIVKDREIQN